MSILKNILKNKKMLVFKFNRINNNNNNKKKKKVIFILSKIFKNTTM
jgi:hypothetical protein